MILKLLIASLIAIFVMSICVYFQYQSNLNLSSEIAKQETLNSNKDDAIMTLESDIRILKQSAFEYQQNLNVLNIENSNAKKLITTQRNKQAQAYITPAQFEKMINANFKKYVSKLECITGEIICE